jgi:hypothetical protein
MVILVVHQYNTTLICNGWITIVYDKIYGEPCSSSSQCTPTSVGMVCNYPYIGALLTVCRCVNGTKYYDVTTRSCKCQFNMY